MAKINFSKLNLKRIDGVEKIIINEQEIEVKQYLPVEEKLQLIANVMMESVDENSFFNPVKVEVFTHLNILYNYTNLSFTSKQQEDAAKLYDILETNNIINAVVATMPKVEYTSLVESVQETIKAFYEAKNSFMGILEQAKNSYSDMNLDITALQEKLNDPDNNLELLKNILDKLG